VLRRLRGQATVSQILDRYGEKVSTSLSPAIRKAGLPYPPQSLKIIGLKAERSLELWGSDSEGRWKMIRTYPILGASGKSGPKLRRGDRQVPEGIYRVDGFNPNSRHHLSLHLDYPNAEDRRQASDEGRTDLGGDICIHGGSGSIGCVAIGDGAIEELFVLAAMTKPPIHVIIAPRDFREEGPHEGDLAGQPRWLGSRYDRIADGLPSLPGP
jgi:murein L,D-transpeptidase YafK